MKEHSKKTKDLPNQDEPVVSFVPGSSVIDIQALRAEMEAEAETWMAEIDSDPELKKDVLDGFQPEASDAELEQLSVSVQQATDRQNQEFAQLSKKIAQELQEDLELANQIMILEDDVLEKHLETNAILDPKVTDEKSATPAKSTGEDSVESVEMSEQDQELRAALPQMDSTGEYALEDLQSCIEALLFYSERPLSLKKIKEMLEMSEAKDELILSALEQLKAIYRDPKHGFEIAEIAGGYQLRTKSSKAPLLRKLAKVQVQRLSRGAMETLTIVAYKQPCTKDDIDQVRGVDSSHFIRTLLDRRLIEMSGRSESAGRPMIYATTDHFLEVFGVMDLGALPALREIEAMVPQMAASAEGEEDPRVVQMRKMVQQMKTDASALQYDSKEDEKILTEIRERVKTIDVTTPYLARQKELATQGITGSEAEEILAREFQFHRSSGDPVAAESISVDSVANEDPGQMGAEILTATDLAEIAHRKDHSEQLV